MKKLLMGAALVALLASPALAQSYNPNLGSGNIVPEPGGAYNTPTGDANWGSDDAYAPSRSRAERGYDAQASAPAYEDGHSVGQDPDPNVRLELRKDWAEMNE
jgi:opacity protein-like surface antigen